MDCSDDIYYGPAECGSADMPNSITHMEVTPDTVIYHHRDGSQQEFKRAEWAKGADFTKPVSLPDYMNTFTRRALP